MELPLKIITGLERIGEVFKMLLWQKAKVYGISPIQIQILLFIPKKNPDLANVSYLAKEFNVTKPTISDAVRVLLKKGYLEKDYSPADKRRYNLQLSTAGKKLVEKLLDYRMPIVEEIAGMSEEELKVCFETISKLIYRLNQKGIIQVQRICFACKAYDGNKKDTHYCKLLEKKLLSQEIKLDCPEFKEK